jgi:cytochrome P450
MTTISGRSLLDDAILDAPYQFYQRLVSEAPVWRVGESDVYVASSYEAVVQACRRVEDFSSQLRYVLYRDDQGLPGRERHAVADNDAAKILATADPPRHGEHKRIISPEFSPKRVASLAPHIASLTHQRLAAGLAAGRMEFMSQLANLIPIEIVCDLIALKERDVQALYRSAIVQTDMLAAAVSRDELQQLLSFSTDVIAWMYVQLEQAVKAPGEGILGLLATAINENAIDHMIALAIVMTLFAAGGESTSSLIGNCVYMLACDGQMQQRLRANADLIPKFVEEVLRLESPFRHHMRFVTRPSTLCGVEMVEGSTLLLLWGAANRDPAQFDRPDLVDLDRPRRHVGFGSGIHTCIGNTLARLEARIVLETLLASTAEFALNSDESPRWVRSLAVRRLQTLPMHLRPSR